MSIRSATVPVAVPPPSRRQSSAGEDAGDTAGETPALPFQCRVGCGACCVAPSISSPIPGMPNGKPAGVRCIHLMNDHRCALYGSPDRPDVCNRLRASVEMCGTNAEEAYVYLERLERLTRPV